MKNYDKNIPLLETVKLDKFFKVSQGTLKAVNGVSLEIERGKTLGLVGESGCGKSTLGKTILRIYEPTGGEVHFNGENILAYNRSMMKKFQAQAQMIFQDPNSSINPRMSVSETIVDPIIVNKLATSKAERQVRVNTFW